MSLASTQTDKEVRDELTSLLTGIVTARVIAEYDIRVQEEIEGWGILLRCPVCEKRRILPLEDWRMNRALHGQPFLCTHDGQEKYVGGAPGVLDTVFVEDNDPREYIVEWSLGGTARITARSAEAAKSKAENMEIGDLIKASGDSCDYFEAEVLDGGSA